MRKKIVTGNWKMNKTPSDAVALVEQLKDKIDTDDVDVVLCVPFVSLAGVGNAIKGTSIKLGVLLDASTANICSKFLFVESDDRELAEAAIYTLPSIQGNFLMLPNTDDEESEINLELLFGAALTDPEKIKGMFHPKQNEQ